MNVFSIAQVSIIAWKQYEVSAITSEDFRTLEDYIGGLCCINSLSAQSPPFLYVFSLCSASRIELPTDIEARLPMDKFRLLNTGSMTLPNSSPRAESEMLCALSCALHSVIARYDSQRLWRDSRFLFDGNKLALSVWPHAALLASAVAYAPARSLSHFSFNHPLSFPRTSDPFTDAVTNSSCSESDSDCEFPSLVRCPVQSLLHAPPLSVETTPLPSPRSVPAWRISHVRERDSGIAPDTDPRTLSPAKRARASSPTNFPALLSSASPQEVTTSSSTTTTFSTTDVTTSGEIRVSPTRPPFKLPTHSATPPRLKMLGFSLPHFSPGRFRSRDDETRDDEDYPTHPSLRPTSPFDSPLVGADLKYPTDHAAGRNDDPCLSPTSGLFVLSKRIVVML